ncbi:hypothetical protein C6A85_02555, partial [Mycobacterium sp. ITM-2017-0098]
GYPAVGASNSPSCPSAGLSAMFGRVLRVNSSTALKSLNARLAAELEVAEARVAAAVRLLDEGATVPFIAR